METMIATSIAFMTLSPVSKIPHLMSACARRTLTGKFDKNAGQDSQEPSARATRVALNIGGSPPLHGDTLRRMPTLVIALIVVYAVFFVLIHAIVRRKP